MTKISLFQTIIDYLNENNYNYKSNNESNLIKIISDENHIINITIKPITEIVDFHLIDIRSIDVLYQISFFYNVPNDNQITNTILEQIKILNKVSYIISNIPKTVNNKYEINNNTIKLELTINLAPEEKNFENYFFDPNDPTDNYSKSFFFNNALNVKNLKLYSSDIGDYIGKITGIKII